MIRYEGSEVNDIYKVMNSIKGINKNKLIVSVVVLIFLAALSLFGMEQTPRKLIICAALSVLSAVFILAPGFSTKLSVAMLPVYLIVFPWKSLQRIEATAYISSDKFYLSFLFVIFVGILIFTITNRTDISLIMLNVIILIITVIAFVRFVPVLQKAGGKQYSELIYSFLYSSFFICFGKNICLSISREGKKFLLTRLVSILAIILFVCVLSVGKEWNTLIPVKIFKTIEVNEKLPWYRYSKTIMHGLGYTEKGENITNSFEAFRYNYNNGERVFETDINITSDNQMVLRHDWICDFGQQDAFGWSDDNRPVPTAEQFLNNPIYDEYTPLSLEDMFKLMKKYPDFYIVTDTKVIENAGEQFKLFVDTAKRVDCEDVLDRVVVQVYTQDMYYEINDVYPFKNYIYTLYMVGYNGPEVTAGFCEENGIKVLTMPADYWSEKIKDELYDYDVKVFVHTVDDIALAKHLLNSGVYGIYTDNIFDRDLK